AWPPVDSRAPVRRPQACSQAARASRSAVQVPKRRTGSGSRSAGTATQWASAPTSMPAASGLVTCRRPRRGRGWGCGKWSLRGVMTASRIRGKGISNEAAGAGATEVEAVSPAGSRRSVSPGLWSPAPGTILTDGHEAPRSRRSPRPAALKDRLRPHHPLPIPFLRTVGCKAAGFTHRPLFVTIIATTETPWLVFLFFGSQQFRGFRVEHRQLFNDIGSQVFPLSAPAARPLKVVPCPLLLPQLLIT